MEKTTVILPTFNRSSYLIETLDSLFAQTLQPDEIIVADDGSTDDTPQVMARLEGRVRYIRKANSGKADTLNQIIPTVQNPLIWIMDDDDLAMPNALADMSGLLNGRPEIGFSYGRYERFRVDPQTGEKIIWDCGYWREADRDGFALANLEDFFVHHPGLLVRRTSYETVGPFELRYGRTEDYEMMIRLARRFTPLKTDNVVFLQRQHDGERHGGLAADQRTTRWMKEEAGIFETARGMLDLPEYLSAADRARPLTPVLRRRALINRSVVMARHRLWSHALEDLAAACALVGNEPLEPQERNAVRRALFSKYGCREVLTDREIKQGLRELARQGPLGRDITRTFAGSLAFFIRTRVQSGRVSEATRYAMLAVSLLAA